MNKKKLTRAIILAILLVILISFYKNPPFSNEQNDQWSVYTKINTLPWQLQKQVNKLNPQVTLKIGDLYSVSLLENSTIAYHWDTDTNSNKLAGIEFIEKRKVRVSKGLQALLPVRDGENNDRVIFVFKVTSTGDAHLTFDYKPNEDTQIENYEKNEFTINLLK